MNTFEERKKHAIWRMEELDRSKKGSVDKHAIPLIEAINAHPNMYTTSSCSGRILLLVEPESKRKDQYEWPLVTHELADANAFVKMFSSLSSDDVWLKMQAAIIHVACRDIETASVLLKQFYPHGWKRSGIFSLENDIMVELLGVEQMSSLIMRNSEKLVDDTFIFSTIEVANKKLAIVHEKLDTATKRVTNLL